MANPGQAQPKKSWPAVLRSAELRKKIKDAKVLCVGAGGIGCELLKTLVCTGFEKIEVIDLDTIETSNLNRQFLFRKHHVGESKARTAAAVVRSFKPSADIVAHHGNVKEHRFGVDYISGFSLVLNGLDNLEARRHVNRLAMAAGVPLVESGTAGYLGQVTVHLKGETECFECSPKPVPKSFPICTLRNTPDKPIHCVVWAKDLLFARLFGKQDTITDLDEPPVQAAGPDPASAEAAAQGAADGTTSEAAEAAAAAAAAEEASAFIKRLDESALQYAMRVFERVYTHDIQRLIGMTELWSSRAPPTPLLLGQLFPDGTLEAVEAALQLKDTRTGVPASRALGLTNPNEKWSAADNARVFLRSIMHYYMHRPQELDNAVFDKDDDLAVDFVTSASNLRAICYGIPTQALFEAKGMAGNIIHAIATTNAIISGAIVMEALKLLAGCRENVRATYLHEKPSGRRLIVPSRQDPPKSGCMACGRALLRLRCNMQQLTLGRLVSEVVKQQLAVVTPMLLAGEFMYEEGEGLEEDEVAANQRLVGLTLNALPGGGLRSGALLHVSDEAQAFSVDLALLHQETFDAEAEPEGWVLEGSSSKPAPVAQAKEAEAGPSKADAGSTQQPQTATAAPAAAGPAFKEIGGNVMALMSDDEDGEVLMTEEPARSFPTPSGAGAALLLTTSKRPREQQEAERVLEADVGISSEALGRASKRAKADDGPEIIELDE